MLFRSAVASAEEQEAERSPAGRQGVNAANPPEGAPSPAALAAGNGGGKPPSAAGPPPQAAPSTSTGSGRLVLNPEILWRRALAELGDFTADVAADFRKVESLLPDCLTVTLGGEYQVNLCNRAERRQRVEECLERIAGRKIRIDYVAAPAAPAATRQIGRAHV